MKTKHPIFWSTLATISLWMAIIMFGLVFLRNCSRPQFFTVSMADDGLTTEILERKGTVDWTQLQVDSLNIIHLASGIDSIGYAAMRNRVLREEMKSGRLMTAEQMSEKITGYYDKLIDVLVALFIIFSVASYFVINNRFRKQYEEDKAEFVKGIRQSLMDSQTLHDDLVNGISTNINRSLVREEDIKSIWEKLSKNDEYFELLASVCDDLTDAAAFKTVILDGDVESDDSETKTEEA